MQTSNGEDANQGDIKALLQQAAVCFKQGRMHEAHKLAKKVLDGHPRHPDANHLLGLIASKAGKFDVAIRFITAAVDTNPEQLSYHHSLGMVCYMAGRFKEAIAAYDRVIQITPADVIAHNGRGIALMGDERLLEAQTAFNRAVEINPQYVEAHYNLALVLKRLGRMEEVLLACEDATRVKPGFAEADNLRGIALMSLERLGEAEAAFVLATRNRSGYAEAFYNLGLVLVELDRLEEAVDAFEQSVHLNPGLADAYNDLGLALRNLGRLEEARDACERAIQLDPDLAKARFNYALLLLLEGNFSRGWKEFEWRWEVEEFSSSRREFDSPLWDGSSLQGKTILLHAEQGFGDTIQFIRYVPYVVKSGGRLILECQEELKCLLSSLPEIELIAAQGEQVPDYDVHAPLMSLPYILGTTVDAIPAGVPYLFPSELSSKLRDKLGMDVKKKNIGIVWGGNPGQKSDRMRSIDLSLLRSLMDVPEVRWLSLQVGSHASDLEDTNGFEEVIDASPYLTDFSVTASLIKQLDLVISVDTAVAHLAGALGAPVWVMQAFKPDWRYLPGQKGSPWYPTMRVFRQTARGDWIGVVEQVHEALMSRNFMNIQGS